MVAWFEDLILQYEIDDKFYIKSFVHDHANTYISNETFSQDFLIMLKYFFVSELLENLDKMFLSYWL